MPKRLQFALACIVLGCMCIIAVNRCNFRPFLRWTHRTPLNKEWLGYRTEKKYTALEIQGIEVVNAFSKTFVTQTGASDTIVVRTRGLPNEAMNISLNDGVLRIEEKDVWSRGLLREDFSSGWFSHWYDDWYMDAAIIIEVPKDKRFTAMQFDLQRSAELDLVEAEAVTVRGDGSPTFKARYCTFGTVTSQGEIRVDMADTALKSRCTLASKDGSIILKAVTAPAVEISSADGRFQAERIDFDELRCRMEDGSCRIDGTIKKKIDIISDDGSVALDLNGTAIAEFLSIRSGDGSITVKNVSAPQADITTEDGQIKMQQCDLHNLTAQAYNSISFDGDLSGICQFTSRNGNIRLLLQKAENDYAISSLTSNTSGTVRAVGNITIENTSKTAETLPVIAGDPNASNKLILSAEEGKITIKTKE
ncbi:MAG: DUF4097 family beta strand repeat-containing protein [Treponema sp.]